MPHTYVVKVWKDRIRENRVNPTKRIFPLKHKFILFTIIKLGIAKFKIVFIFMLLTLKTTGIKKRPKTLELGDQINKIVSWRKRLIAQREIRELAPMTLFNEVVAPYQGMDGD